jgi:hypothetical protein
MFMDTVSSKPLFERLPERGDVAAFAKKIGAKSTQAVYNWKKRGIPKGVVRDVAAALGLTVEQYYELATKGTAGADRKIKEKNVPRSDGETLLVMLRAFLDTDSEGRVEMAEAIASVVDGHGLAKLRGRSGSRNKRR